MTKIPAAIGLILALSALILTPAGPASGQTQTQMNQAASKAAANADAVMNADYKKLAAVLTAPQRASLKKSQTAWLRFRDAEAEFLSLGSLGGSVHPAVYAMRLRQLTQQRSEQLKEARRHYTTEGDL